MTHFFLSRFGSILLGRTFAPTSGSNQSIFGGINVPWTENVDAIDPLNTFVTGNSITVPSGAVFADITCQITVRNNFTGAPAFTAQFEIRQLSGSTVVDTFTSPTVSVPANVTTSFPILVPKTRFSTVAGRTIRVFLTQTGSSSAVLSRGTAVSFIDIDWIG